MPGKLKVYSDRGKISNLTKKHEDEIPVTPMEERLKKLYEHAQVTHDKGLEDSLGFITTPYISDKAALPLSIYKLREIVSILSTKPGNKIAEMRQELEPCFDSPVIEKSGLSKTASRIARKPGPFRRVSI